MWIQYPRIYCPIHTVYCSAGFLPKMFRLKTALDETSEQAEGLRRENKALTQELRDAADQLNDGGRGVHELAKAKRRLELEKEELQMALEDAEAALEAEESKVLRAQVGEGKGED